MVAKEIEMIQTRTCTSHTAQETQRASPRTFSESALKIITTRDASFVCARSTPLGQVPTFKTHTAHRVVSGENPQSCWGVTQVDNASTKGQVSAQGVLPSAARQAWGGFPGEGAPVLGRGEC